MQYNIIKKAKFISRPNRFIANVLIDGVKERVHVPNTGRCKELLVPDATLILEDCKDRPNRKTRYSVIGVYKGDTLINMDSQVPNAVVAKALLENNIPDIKNPSNIKREVTYKNSRFDIFFEEDGQKTFLEVKGVTLEEKGIAQFPDAPTTRGTKHVYEMIEALDEGYKGIIFFLIQMKGPRLFRLQWERDPEFSRAVKTANKKGIKVLAYDSIVTENSISIGKAIKVNLED